jgi:hypothetical protein
MSGDMSAYSKLVLLILAFTNLAPDNVTAKKDTESIEELLNTVLLMIDS